MRAEGKLNIKRIREAEAKLGKRVEVQPRDPEASVFSEFLSIPVEGGAGKDDMSTSIAEIRAKEKKGGGK